MEVAGTEPKCLLGAEAICGLPYRPETLDLDARWEEQHRPYLGHALAFSSVISPT